MGHCSYFICVIFSFFSVPNIALNVDLAPTLLDIGGVTVPDHMDGKSIMKLFENVDEPNRYVIKRESYGYFQVEFIFFNVFFVLV